MKTALRLCVILCAAFLLSACGSKQDRQTAVTALILDGEHYSAEAGSVSVEPGETASFRIATDPGYMVVSADYRGEYRLTQEHGFTKLELIDIRYPSRVRLDTTRYAVTINYEANGGDGITSAGKSASVSYDITAHIRPNVSIGTDLFERKGYTLTSWNTAPDGSGTRVGLGSRMTVEDPVTLYAQWEPWTDGELFTYRIYEDKAVLTGYAGTEETVVVPERIGSCPVAGIDPLAFENCSAKRVVLPKTIERIEKNAFQGAELSELSLFDNIEYLTDASFSDCRNLSTVRISAIEDPYGYSYRRESVLSDKIDRLIVTMGQDRLIFYGGCAMWYNLISSEVLEAFGDEYTVLNMGVNGVMGSLFQMELLRAFMTDRDILIHAPEISSRQQLLLNTGLITHDDKMWSALEYNYDLVSLVDVRLFDGTFFESFRHYLARKKPGGKYTDVYRDSKGRAYLDKIGSVPYERTETAEKLSDSVELLPENFSDLSRLAEEYALFREKGIPIYVSYAAIDLDDVPEEQQGNVDLIGQLYAERFTEMDGVTVISDIHDFLYRHDDCFDTVYHLLTEPARNCTRIWIRDLSAALEADGRRGAGQ